MSTALSETTKDAYANPWIPYAFDALIATVYAPLGQLRERALDALDLTPGCSVLELGCGTGGITRRLVQRGASVTGVDRSAAMLRRAHKRAPGAELVQYDVRAFKCDRRFDRVLLAFLLHELESADRIHVLRQARERLAPGGIVGVLDHSLPASGLWARPWRHFIEALEPESAREVLYGALRSELAQAGLEIADRRSLAGGRAELLIARPEAEA